MALARVLAIRAVTLTATLIGIVLVTAIILGPTSDKLLNAIINEDVRAYSQALRQRAAGGALNQSEIDALVTQYRDQLIRAYALDRPWYERIIPLAMSILRLDLGRAGTITSFTGSNDVRDIILERIPPTILFLTTATLINIALGLTLGPLLAFRRGGILDRFFSIYSAVSYALPAWWLGLMLIYVFVYRIPIFPPPTGLLSPNPPTDPLGRFLDMASHAALPIITFVLATSGVWIYVTRAIVVRIVEEDFVYVAKAKGLHDRTIMRGYIMRAAAPPIATNAILGLAGSLGGAILTETIFNWPGLGRLFYDAIGAQELPLILGLTYITALVYVIARMILEILYIFLDPRVRY
jgi:peptide/nickel transport system permease protein